MSARGDGMTRMTPRVPLAGDVSKTTMTPRGGGAAVHASGRSSSRTPAYRGSNGRQYEISPVKIGALERDKMLYLAKKLVHLSILLEQDTVVDDFAYPSFHK